MKRFLLLVAIIATTAEAADRRAIEACRAQVTQQIQRVDAQARQRSTEQLRQRRTWLESIRAECSKNPAAWKLAR